MAPVYLEREYREEDHPRDEHGRWSDAEGSNESPTNATNPTGSRARLPLDLTERVTQVYNVMHDTLRSMGLWGAVGYEVSLDVPTTGNVGGYGVAGIYDNETNKITMYARQLGMPTVGWLRSAITHEATHAKFNLAGGNDASSPIGAFITSHFIDLNDQGRAVSDYAKAWWDESARADAAYSVTNPNSAYLWRVAAINETLADLHKLVGKSDKKYPPVYRQLNKLVDSEYKARHHTRVTLGAVYLEREYREEDHPRDEHGRWSDAGSSSASQARTGGGARGRAKPTSPMLPIDSVARSSRVREIADDVLNKAGMPDAKFVVVSGEPPLVTLNTGESGNIDGRYVPEKDLIELFHDGLIGATEAYVRELVKHEATHARFTVAGGYKKGTAVNDFISDAENAAKLKNEDGTTPYAYSHWLLVERAPARVQAGAMFRYLRETAINESLAEMQSHGPMQPTYAKLDALIRSEYAKATRKGVIYLNTKYSDDQPRDENGRWTDAGGSSGGTSDKPLAAHDSSVSYDVTAQTLPMRASDFVRANEFLPSPSEQSMEQMSRLIMEVGRNAATTNEWDRAATAKKEIELRLVAGLKDNAKWKACADALGLESGRAVALLIHSWAASSSGNNPTAALMQAMATKEFGLNGTHDASIGLFSAGPQTAQQLAEKSLVRIFGREPTADNAKALQTGCRVLLRETYKQTQADLKSAGIKSLYVVRGVSNHLPEGTRDIELNPMSSFSTNGKIGVHYARANGTLLITKVPASRILSTPRSGFGCRVESEVVVLGGKTRAVHVNGESPNWKVRARELLAQGKAAAVVVGVFSPDEDPVNADWLKTEWDLPPYKSTEFMAVYPDLETFKTLPVYRFAVDNGLIVNDEWQGYREGTTKDVTQREYDESKHPRDEHGRWTSGDGGSGSGNTPNEASPSVSSTDDTAYGKYTINAAEQSAAAWCVRQTDHTQKEYAVAFHPDGHPVRIAGIENRVHLTPEMRNALLDKGVDFVHSHPSVTSLSGGDIGAAIQLGMKNITVAAVDGSMFGMSFPVGDSEATFLRDRVYDVHDRRDAIKMFVSATLRRELNTTITNRDRLNTASVASHVANIIFAKELADKKVTYWARNLDKQKCADWMHRLQQVRPQIKSFEQLADVLHDEMKRSGEYHWTEVKAVKATAAPNVGSYTLVDSPVDEFSSASEIATFLALLESSNDSTDDGLQLAIASMKRLLAYAQARDTKQKSVVYLEREYNEEDHPRDEHGRWTDAGGGSGGPSAHDSTSPDYVDRVTGRTGVRWTKLSPSVLNMDGHFDGDVQRVDELPPAKIDEFHAQINALRERVSADSSVTSEQRGVAGNALYYANVALNTYAANDARFVAVNKDGRMCGGATMHGPDYSAGVAKLDYLGSFQRGGRQSVVGTG